MRRWAAVLATVVLFALAAPEVFELDPAQTFVHFEIRHFDTSTLRGRFGPMRGEVMLDAAAGRGRVGLVIDTRTLDTGFRLLDARLRQGDLLDVAYQPEAYFVAQRLRFEQGRPIELIGEFTLRGKNVPLTLRALRCGCIAPAGGSRQRCGGDFEGEVLRSEFGATSGLPFVADKVRLLVQAEGLRQPQRPAWRDWFVSRAHVRQDLQICTYHRQIRQSIDSRPAVRSGKPQLHDRWPARIFKRCPSVAARFVLRAAQSQPIWSPR